MAVSDFGGVARRFRGDGIDAEFVYFFRGLRREDDAEAQSIEKSEPEGVIFVHVEHAWYADGSARGIFRRAGGIAESSIEFVSIEVGDLACIGFTERFFASVSSDEFVAVVKGIDREEAIVRASAASSHRDFIAEIAQRVAEAQFAFDLIVGASRLSDEGAAVGAHETCDIGS